MDISQILGNHCFYCNGLGYLHNIRRGEMTHAELNCALLELNFFNFHFFPPFLNIVGRSLIHLLSGELVLCNEDNRLNTLIHW